MINIVTTSYTTVLVWFHLVFKIFSIAALNTFRVECMLFFIAHFHEDVDTMAITFASIVKTEGISINFLEKEATSSALIVVFHKAIAIVPVSFDTSVNASIFLNHLPGWTWVAVQTLENFI